MPDRPQQGGTRVILPNSYAKRSYSIRFGGPALIISLALLAGGCSGGGNHHRIILPTATATPVTSPTPTPATSPTPTPAGSVTATPTPAGPTPTPTAALSTALWVENSGSANITEFSGSTLATPIAVPSPAVTNKSPDLSPDTAGVTFDAANNQWASVCGNSSGNHGSIAQFNAAAVTNLPVNSAPAANVVLSDDGTGNLISCPWALKFDPAGNLWAANSNEFQVVAGAGYVTQYQPAQLTASGHPTPHITLTDPTEFNSPTGVVLDSTGNLFVSDFGPAQFGKAGSGKVFVFTAATVAALTPGTNTVKSDAQLSDATTLTPVNGAFDPSGNLWIADCEANSTGEIYMFPKASLTTTTTSATTIFQSTSITTPNGTENTIDCPGGIAFDSLGNLWYTNFLSVKVDGAVGEFSAAQLSVTGTSSPTPTVFLDGDPSGINLNAPIGLTFGPQV